MGEFIPYIIRGDSKREKLDGVEFEIRNSRQEQTFRGFSQKGSPQDLLCQLVSEDPLLKLLLFLKPQIGHQPIETHPLTLEYPIFLDYNKHFIESINREPRKAVLEDKRKEQTDFGKNVKDLSSRLMWRFFTTAIGDKQIAERIRRRGPRLPDEEMDSLFSGLVKRHTKAFDDLMTDFADTAGRFFYGLEHYAPVIKAFDKSEQAFDNLETLSYISELKADLAEALGESLAKLIGHRIFRVLVDSICLECLLTRGFEPFSMMQKYPAKPSLPTQCGKCGGKTVFHRIVLEAPYSFAPLFTENRLPEFIIGYELAQSCLIKRVYVHKKVQVVAKKGLEKGIPVNVLAITNNGKTLLVEVTTSKDLNAIAKDAKKKEKVLGGLSSDRLVFVSPVNIDRYADFGDIRIFGARHILKLKSHIEHLIQEIS